MAVIGKPCSAMLLQFTRPRLIPPSLLTPHPFSTQFTITQHRISSRNKSTSSSSFISTPISAKSSVINKYGNNRSLVNGFPQSQVQFQSQGLFQQQPLYLSQKMFYSVVSQNKEMEGTESGNDESLNNSNDSRSTKLKRTKKRMKQVDNEDKLNLTIEKDVVEIEMKKEIFRRRKEKSEEVRKPMRKEVKEKDQKEKRNNLSKTNRFEKKINFMKGSEVEEINFAERMKEASLRGDFSQILQIFSENQRKFGASLLASCLLRLLNSREVLFKDHQISIFLNNSTSLFPRDEFRKPEFYSSPSISSHQSSSFSSSSEMESNLGNEEEVEENEIKTFKSHVPKPIYLTQRFSQDLLQDNRYLMLLEEIEIVMKKKLFRPRELAEIAYFLSLLATPNDQLFKEIARNSVQSIQLFGPIDIAKLLAGFAIGRFKSEKLFEKLAQKSQMYFQIMNQNELEAIIYSFASLGFIPEEKLFFEKFAGACITKIDQFSPLELTRICFSFSLIHPDKLSNRSLPSSIFNLDKDQQENKFEGSGMETISIHDAILRSIEKKSMEKAENFLAKEASRLIVFMTNCKYTPSRNFTSILSRQLFGRLPSLSHFEFSELCLSYCWEKYTVDILGGIGGIRGNGIVHWRDQLFQAIHSEIKARIKKLDGNSVCKIAGGLGKSQLVSNDIFKKIANIANQEIQDGNVQPNEIVLLALGFALSHITHKQLMDTLLSDLSKNFEKYDPNQLIHLLWSFAILGIIPSDSLVRKISKKIVLSLTSLSLCQISHFLFSLAVFQHSNPQLISSLFQQANSLVNILHQNYKKNEGRLTFQKHDTMTINGIDREILSELYNSETYYLKKYGRHIFIENDDEISQDSNQGKFGLFPPWVSHAGKFWFEKALGLNKKPETKQKIGFEEDDSFLLDPEEIQKEMEKKAQEQGQIQSLSKNQILDLMDDSIHQGGHSLLHSYNTTTD